MTTSAASENPQQGFKCTFVKLEFTPSFGLTDTGPQGEEAVRAWETTLHEIYFLGGGPQDYPPSTPTRSETHWGRVVGTQNQAVIATIRLNTHMSVHIINPIISRNEAPGVLSHLAPFLLHAPKVITVCFECLPMYRTWHFACDLNLFHIPTVEPKERDATIQIIRSAKRWIDLKDQNDLQDHNYGRLYALEGVARSFKTDDGTATLDNKETYVHMTLWTNRELSETYKDPTQKNGGMGHSQPDNFYATCFAREFALAESRQGVIREEIQVEFKRWAELWPEGLRGVYAANYPGSIPTHPIHGRDCEKCEPWADHMLEESYLPAAFQRFGHRRIFMSL